MRSIPWIKQARLALASAGLLFIYTLASCTSPAIPTPSPLPATGTEEPSTPTSPAPKSTATLVVNTGELQTYLVKEGDTLSSIAAHFGLQPETVLWANVEQLFDNPDFLLPGMQLLILPVDGVYHQVGGTDTLTSIATFFNADPQAIADWPGNKIDESNPVVFAGEWLVVPGGQRLLRRRLMPNLPRFAMAVSFEEFGSGACPQNVSDGSVGDGEYAWPVARHEVVGEGFYAAHPGVDLAVEIGEEIRAADDGVVVFSGWSNLGYGYMVMLDHGNGGYTLYGGLGEVLAECGSEIGEGDVIGAGGLIGHPAGPFLHFEIRRGEEFLNPLELLP